MLQKKMAISHGTYNYFQRDQMNVIAPGCNPLPGTGPASIRGQVSCKVTSHEVTPASIVVQLFGEKASVISSGKYPCST